MISLSLELWGLESKVSAFVEDVQEQMRSEVAAVQSDELSLESETFLRQYVAMNNPFCRLAVSGILSFACHGFDFGGRPVNIGVAIIATLVLGVPYYN